MVSELVGFGSGIAVNYISDELIQRLRTYKDRKTVREFWAALDRWAQDFERDRDGTIAVSGAFHDVVKHYGIVEKVVSYVLVPDAGGQPEQLFLERLEQTISEELSRRLERGLSPEDGHIIHGLLDSLLRRTKDFALRKTAPEDKALLYLICQNNMELSQLRQTVKEQFQGTAEMLQKILRHLEPSELIPEEDGAPLPEEFNALIRRCNDALRGAQRMVKVYSWDDLDFRSVYVLPSLELFIEPYRSFYRDARYYTPADMVRIIGKGSGGFLQASFHTVSDIDLLYSYNAQFRQSLPDYFVNSMVSASVKQDAKREDSPQKRRAAIDQIFLASDIVYVIGGAGYGKSLFLKNLCVSPPRDLCSPGNEALIIRGDLKRMIRPDGSFKPMLEYLSECLTNGSLQSREELPENFLQRCLRAGRCLILLDALDEVGNDQRNELHRLVVSYFRDSGLKNKVCITSRDRGFIPEENVFCLSIQPITEEDVREYVDRYIALGKFQESEKERFIRQASSLVDKGFVKGFLTLSLLLAIYKNEQELPANKVALYQKCFEYIANTREKNKNLLYNGSTGKAYDWDVLAKLMGDATFMELAQLGTPNNRDIPRDAIDARMTQLYVQRFHSETDCRAAIEVFLQFCADRTEVFVPSPNSNTEYRFFHRSFYEFFYANYIATRTRFPEDTYQKLDGFEVDSELFELLVQLYTKNNPTYLRELMQYAFQQAEEQLDSPAGDASRAFDILVLLMQTADENDFAERFIQLFLDRGGRISALHLHVSFDMIGTVFEKNQTFFTRYFEEHQDALLERIAVDLSKFLIRNQDQCQQVLKKPHVFDYFAQSADSQNRFLYRRLLRLLPNRLVLIDRIFESMNTPRYMYCTLKAKGASASRLASFAKKVRERPVREQEKIYMALIFSL